MADSPSFEVRLPGGEYKEVLLAPGASGLDVKEVVAGAVGLPMGTFFLKNDAGVSTVFHSGLTGRWTAVLFSAPAAGEMQGGAGCV